MTIKQALKYKNKLVSKMNIEFNRVNQYNSVEDGEKRPYSASEALSKYFEFIIINMSFRLIIRTA